MWALIFLFICALIDMKYHQIPIWLLCLGSVVTLCYRFFHLHGQIAIWIGGIAIGLFFLFISRWTKEGMGYADSWMILLLGIYLGFWETMWLLCITFFIAGIVALGYVVKNQGNKKASIPFIPFLFLGYLGVMYL